jgi:hypothetical protein
LQTVVRLANESVGRRQLEEAVAERVGNGNCFLKISDSTVVTEKIIAIKLVQ